MTVRVTTAEQAAARDAAAIGAGIASWTLMQAAGGATAHLILQRYPDVRISGAIVYAGRGNNGGDAYVVARVLAEARCPVSVVAAGDPTTDDARRAQVEALAFVSEVSDPQRPAVIVDGLLGVGISGEVRPEIAEQIRAISEWRGGRTLQWHGP